MKKGGQISIFIIIGVVAITSLSLFFLFKSGIIPTIGEAREMNPNLFLQSCIENKIQDTAKTISLNGGSMNPKLNKTFKFEGEEKYSEIAYLCYNGNYYTPCINQEPMLIQHLKSELKENIEEEMGNCFDELIESLEKQNEVVDTTYNGFEIDVGPKKIVVDINAEAIITKSGETSKRENFQIIVSSRFYDLAEVVHEIVNQEARFCSFENLGFMLFYPQFNIDKLRTEESTIYTVEYRPSGEKFRFATRGCVIPPGI